MVSQLIMYPLSSARGIRASNLMTSLCQLAGIRDIGIKIQVQHCAFPSSPCSVFECSYWCGTFCQDSGTSTAAQRGFDVWNWAPAAEIEPLQICRRLAKHAQQRGGAVQGLQPDANGLLCLTSDICTF